MSLLLRSFLKRCVRKGSLDVEITDGQHFTLGDGTGTLVGLRFKDKRAEREILLNPALALGELFTEGRLEIIGGTIVDLLNLLGRKLEAMTPPALGALRQRARTALGALHLRNTAQR